ncbi:hypothetical protein EJ110_NYTH49934 [Nymphaea thermarum]|nr:hypothetical protein EJ110_NYTH49934 [Nymphaea thermarum]
MCLSCWQAKFSGRSTQMELHTSMDTSAPIFGLRALCLSRQSSAEAHESPPPPPSARTERGRRTRKE